MELIPALDLRQGQVVRLAQGDDSRRKAYARDPFEVLAEIDRAGLERVHVVDLDGAFGEGNQRPLLERLAALGRPRVELGGGLRGREDVEWALGAGVERVILGSLVARDFDAFSALAKAFPGRVMPALEVQAGELRIAGWREAVDLRPETLARRLQGLPCPAILVTDVARDGTLEGPNLELTQEIGRWSGLPALVSGGIHSLEDLRRATRRSEIAGAIVGKALYEGVFSLEEARDACRGEAP